MECIICGKQTPSNPDKLCALCRTLPEDNGASITPKERKEAVDGFIKLTVTHTVNFFRLMGFESHIDATVLDDVSGQRFEFKFNRLIQLPTEPTEWFPLGAELTSLENGKLIVAPEGTPREEIVGVVTLDGLKTK